MTRPLLLLVISIAAVALLVISLRPDKDSGLPHSSEKPLRPLVVACAASNRAVMEQIAKEYQREFHMPIEFQFGPSQTLLSSIEVSGLGDLYLPADASYLDIAHERGLVEETFGIARMQVILGVPKTNPLGIDSFADLLEKGVRVVQASPDVAAVGKLTRETLQQQEKWEPLKEHTTAFVSTVTEAANSVLAEAADVGIVYDAVLSTYPDLEAVRIDEFRDCFAEIRVGLIATSQQQPRARHFVRYVTACDRGLKHYQKFGFTPVEGDDWTGEALP